MTEPLHDTLQGFPSGRTIFQIDSLEISVVNGDMPFVIEEGDAIRDNWQQEVLSRPRLFDGRMLMNRSVSFSGGRLTAQAHIIPYSAFMWWRKQMPRRGGIHMFAYPVIESSDGALIAVQMSAHTANAGQVYFAAGSFDENDVVNGYCDVDGNMRREVMEETGLDIFDSVAGRYFYACHTDGVIALFRMFRFDLTANEIVALVNAHVAMDEEEEISGPVIIRSSDPAAFPYSIHMLPILEWYFGAPVKTAAI